MMNVVNEVGERTRRLPYYPLTLGLIQPEWLFMYHYLTEEPDEEERNLPPETAEIEAEEKHGVIRINFRARRDPATP
jgi:hypothetical protein